MWLPSRKLCAGLQLSLWLCSDWWEEKEERRRRRPGSLCSDLPTAAESMCKASAALWAEGRRQQKPATGGAGQQAWARYKPEKDGRRAGEEEEEELCGCVIGLRRSRRKRGAVCCGGAGG